MSASVKKGIVSVFTPTYNRKHTIVHLYKSLCNQTVKDFEWIVVDDGSTDGTRELIKKIGKNDNGFECIYKQQENGGKHRAINLGITLASGEYFFIVDSDDIIPPDAIEKIIDMFRTIDTKQFAGICGNKCYRSGAIVGSTFYGDMIDCKMSDRCMHNITGDKAEVFYTKVLKRFPFPCYKGENFLSEGVVWNRISMAGYMMRFFNENIYTVQYLSGGLSDNLANLRRNNINGTLLFFLEQYMMETSLWKKCKNGSFYVRYARYNKKSFRDIKKTLNVGWMMLLLLYIFSIMRIIQGW